MSAGTLAGLGERPAARRDLGRRASRPLLGVLPARLLATAALGAFGALHWARQLDPAPYGRLLAMLAVALAAGLVVRRSAALPRALRVPAVAAVALALLVGSLLLAGIPAVFLEPSAWDELASQVSGALSAMPAINVPYRGADEWVRWTILLGATLLLAGGAVAALWPGGGARSRAAALLALGLLYVVPAVESDLPGRFGRGLAFGALLAAFLLLERVQRRNAGPAAVATCVALLAGLLAALALDRARAPLDYERIAASLEQRSDPRFSWDHSYGPITWPRDGREVLRVRAQRSAYWKTENLDGFDGLRWVRARLVSAPTAADALPAPARRRAAWLQTIHVRITGMRTAEFVGAGATLDVTRSPRQALQSGSPGTYVVGGELKRGDAYDARVYVPNPSAEELGGAGDGFPAALSSYLTVDLPNPADAIGPDIPVTYPFFGERARPLALEPSGLSTRTGGQITAASVYGRAYALARRLRARASSPYQYVRAVEGYLGSGFRYTEAPPQRAVPLESFLFRDRAGYCQQFSGAMALLLRMGGVPARVATGFAPGTLDRRRGEYVVRDLDAHSWVEAWFPGYGWVPFDPTPSVAPAASQAPPAQTPSAAAPPRGDTPQSGPRVAQPGDEGGKGVPWLLAGAAALLALSLAGAVVLARAVRPPVGVDPLVAELQRALERTGRPASPGTTLRELEARFAGSPQAAGYLRAVREARYQGRGEGPTSAQRTGLRRELASGLGPSGRLRALLALPPRRGGRSVRPAP